MAESGCVEWMPRWQVEAIVGRLGQSLPGALKRSDFAAGRAGSRKGGFILWRVAPVGGRKYGLPCCQGI